MQKERGKWRNQRHRPTLALPSRTPCHPLFSYPFAHSSSRHSTRPLKVLFVPLPLYLPSSFDLVSRAVALYSALPLLRFHAYRQMELFCSRIGEKLFVNCYLFKLISISGPISHVLFCFHFDSYRYKPMRLQSS